MTNFQDKLNDPHHLSGGHLFWAFGICVLVCAALLASVHFANAQPAPTLEPPASKTFKAAVGSYVGFSVIDAGQTGACLSSPRCAEANPFLKPFAGSPAGLVTAKLAANSGAAYGIWKLRRRHPKAALVAAITMAGVQGVVIAVNVKQMRKAQR